MRTSEAIAGCALIGFMLTSNAVAASRDPVVSACQDGERVAFATLYNAHARGVYRVCLALLHNEAAAEDAVQQTFTIAFQKIGTFNHTSKVSTWLSSIAIRVVANQHRSGRRRDRLHAGYQVDSSMWQQGPLAPDRQTANKRDLERIERALERLPEEKRSLLVLFHFQGMSLTEVAGATGASLQTTRARLIAARRALLDELGGETA